VRRSRQRGVSGHDDVFVGLGFQLPAAVSVSSTSAKLTPSSFGAVAFGAAGSGRAAGLDMMSAAEVTPVHIPSAPAITDAVREKSVQPASQ
jgi:hypothetical protein